MYLAYIVPTKHSLKKGVYTLQYVHIPSYVYFCENHKTSCVCNLVSIMPWEARKLQATFFMEYLFLFTSQFPTCKLAWFASINILQTILHILLYVLKGVQIKDALAILKPHLLMKYYISFAIIHYCVLMSFWDMCSV